MSNVNDTTLEYESAALPPAGLPTEKEKASLAGAEVTAPDDDDGEEYPTPEELSTLKKVPAPLAFAAFCLCFVELSERASYFGSSQIFANFVNNPLPAGGNGAGAVAKGAAGANQSAGALGMGSVSASAVSSTFTFLAYVTPILGGIVSDSYWGRYKTICVGVAVGAIAHVLLVIPGIPSVIASGHGFAPFIIAVLILSFASGFIKASLGPMLCDQSPVKKPVIRLTKAGERVILDPQTTVTRYLLIFYWAINIGSFFAIATSYSERLVGFWLAFLEPGIVYMLCPIVLALVYSRLYKAPPQGSVVLEAFKVFKTLFAKSSWGEIFRGGDAFWNNAKPSHMAPGAIGETGVFWDDLFVEELRASCSASVVFFLTPIFILADGAIGNQYNDMSVAMKLGGIPNDIMNNFNSLAIIVATPILTWGVYPFFERIGLPLKPMTRLSIGFILGMLTMIFSALIQWRIYETSPCGWGATTCDDVSPVSIAWMIPLYAVPAVGELFVMVTGYELAYTRAPARMKGLVYAICLFSSAISAAISLACSAAITDPNLIWPYIPVAALCLVCAIIFPVYFKHLNEPMENFADVDRMQGKHQPNYVEEKVAGDDEAY
ncbi:hypothetical protein Q8F55_005132 [Vanrija albida]|uniref:Major facilitator superfamily (MFS) profile domain-containing protein n=1 Tax=Vanrija albida TaxID=181172 RepID=A0ABR3Q0S2_9TREE